MPNALSVRPRSLYESIDDEVYFADGSRVDFDATRRLVILIHGFNNSEAAARRSFAEFRARVDDAVPPRELWEFHWPGDHPDEFLSKVTYPVRVIQAQRAGERLAAFILGLVAVESVCIVAHSLGCRVALEAAKAIARSKSKGQGAAIEYMFLLAAAVPVPLCDGIGRPFPTALPGSKERVFHSRSDRVLAHGFERFQALVGLSEEGPAVGRDGDPGGRWNDRVDTGLGHGDYWASKVVGSRIAGTLGRARPRALSARHLPDDSSAVAPREIGHAVLDESRPPTRVPG